MLEDIRRKVFGRDFSIFDFTMVCIILICFRQHWYVSGGLIFLVCGTLSGLMEPLRRR